MIVLLTVVVLAAVSFAPTAEAVTPAQLNDCLDMTTSEALRSKRIVQGLGLTADQVRQVRARLVTFNSVRGFAGLDGLGLTEAQRTEILRRIQLQVDEWNRHPLGWPCAPFKSQTKVARWVYDKLVFDGFRPNVKMRAVSARQIQFDGVQDGVRMLGVVVRTGPRQIAVRLEAVSLGWAESYRFTLPFAA